MTWELIAGMIAVAAETWGFPTALTGLFFWLIRRDIGKKDKAREEAAAERERRAEERERNREELDLVLLQSTSAALALGEATARAVQRIPDAHCNGDMHSALAYATGIKHRQKEFLTKLGVHALHEE